MSQQGHLVDVHLTAGCATPTLTGQGRGTTINNTSVIGSQALATVIGIGQHGARAAPGADWDFAGATHCLFAAWSVRLLTTVCGAR